MQATKRWYYSWPAFAIAGLAFFFIAVGLRVAGLTGSQSQLVASGVVLGLILLATWRRFSGR